MNRLIFLLSIVLLFTSTLFAQGRNSEAKTPTIAERVAGMEKFPRVLSILLGRESRQDLARDRQVEF